MTSQDAHVPVRLILSVLDFRATGVAPVQGEAARVRRAPGVLIRLVTASVEVPAVARWTDPR